MHKHTLVDPSKGTRPVPRSYLFVPADRPERIAKALSSGADAVIVDLEDAVAPAAKDSARQALRTWLGGPEAAPVWVRINGVTTPAFAADLAACAVPAVQGVVLPKAERAEDIATVTAALPGKGVLPLVETAAGLAAALEVARAPGVQRLVFGTIDFQADLGIDGDGDELLFFRSQLVLASRLAGLLAPVDGVTPALNDEARVEQETDRARRLGFGAKLCIHPAQVAAVHRAFAPSAREIAWAQKVVQAADAAGGAAVAVDGAMVDAPVLLRARAILARA